EELSALSTRFQNNLLADTNESAVVVDDVSELDGLSDDAIAAAAQAARDRGLDGKYVLTLVLPSGQPALAPLTDRAVRARLEHAPINRGANGTAYDNSATVQQMVTLRAERAALLGYGNHAEYVLADSTAGSPAAVHEMLDPLVPTAVANAYAEAARLQDVIGDEFELQPWDWAYFSEKVRRASYDIDGAELRPYFELERVVRDGVFF